MVNVVFPPLVLLVSASQLQVADPDKNEAPAIENAGAQSRTAFAKARVDRARIKLLDFIFSPTDVKRQMRRLKCSAALQRLVADGQAS